MRTAFLSAALIAASFGLAAPAQANLIFNGGFESGDFTSWTEVGNTTFNGVTCPGADPRVNQGNCAGFFGPVETTGGLIQAVNTVAGNNYTVAFSLLADGGKPSSFSAFFGGNILLLLDDPPASGLYTDYSFVVLANGPSTNLSFLFQDDQGFLYLDSVSVLDNGPAAVVPEPSAWALMLAGFGAAGLMMRRRRGRRLDGAAA